MIFNDTYRKYLLHQAKNHPALLHTEGSRVFQMIGVQEAIGDFRSNIQEKGFIMRGIWYTYGFNFSGNIEKSMTGGFIVAKYHSHRAGGKDSFFEAMRDSEKVVDQIIAKMINDSRNGHPLFNYSLNDPTSFNIQAKHNAGEVGYSGYLATFQFNSFWNECMDQQTAWNTTEEGSWTTPDGDSWVFDGPLSWGDGGLTPEDL